MYETAALLFHQTFAALPKTIIILAPLKSEKGICVGERCDKRYKDRVSYNRCAAIMRASVFHQNAHGTRRTSLAAGSCPSAKVLPPSACLTRHIVPPASVSTPSPHKASPRIAPA